MQFCDLHTHSTASDGTDSPSQIVEYAVEIGLSAVALCDHDTIAGLCEFLESAKDKDIMAVAGAEFSVDYNGNELHLLGLFIPEESFGELSDLMSAEVERKKKQKRELIEKLNSAGYQVDIERILEAFPDGLFNRVPIAKQLVEKGYVSSIEEAFNTLLSESGGFYNAGERITVWQMLDILHKVGAVPVLAHPLKSVSEEILREFLPLAKEKGLAGMECFYSEYDEETTQKAFSIADEFGLLYSGGSDYHGDNKPHIKLGTGTGGLRIPFDFALELERVSQNCKTSD